MKFSPFNKALISTLAIIFSLSIIFYLVTASSKTSHKILISESNNTSIVEDTTILYSSSNTNTSIVNQNKSNEEVAVTTALNGRIIGFIRDIKDENGELLVYIDEVQFYLFDEAKIKRAEDGLEESIVPYYIRNTTADIIIYKLDKSSNLSLCSYIITPDSPNADIPVEVSFDSFKNYVSSNISNNERSLLFWFYIDDGIIVKVEMQYTP